MKTIFTLLAFLFAIPSLYAQNAGTSFIEYQKTYTNASGAMKRKEDTLRKQFEARGLKWPAKYIYLRNFKKDGQLEIWVKNERKEPFKFFKTYMVCALAGSLGPKRMAGDYQVPEGFYFINEFKPRSNYHLALGINYPNPSDKMLSDSMRPGGDIYIHGSCVTVGCIPLTNDKIEEVYLIAAYAKNMGQDFIPVHIFPIRYDNKKSATYLNTLTKSNGQLRVFAQNLKNVFDHFEATRQLPVIMVDSEGDYVFDGLVKPQVTVQKEVVVKKPVKERIEHRHREIANIADAVQEGPEFPGGGANFLNYLEKSGKKLVSSLPNNMKKAYVVVEFVVDKDGVPVNFKVVKGVNEDFDDELITELEQMPKWKPATFNKKPVAKKLKQGFAIE